MRGLNDDDEPCRRPSEMFPGFKQNLPWNPARVQSLGLGV